MNYFDPRQTKPEAKNLDEDNMKINYFDLDPSRIHHPTVDNNHVFPPCKTVSSVPKIPRGYGASVILKKMLAGVSSGKDIKNAGGCFLGQGYLTTGVDKIRLD
jgi:hypothetical protein